MGVRARLKEAQDLIGADLPLFSVAAFIVISLSMLTGSVLSLPLVVGLYIMFLEKMRGAQPKLGHLWEGITGHFPAAIVTWIVYMLACAPVDVAAHFLIMRPAPWPPIGLSVWLLGTCLISTPIFFALPAIADRDLSARDAAKLSWQYVRPRFLTIFGLSLVYAIIRLFGIFACGLGIILLLPVVVGAQLLMYRDIIGNQGTPQMTPIRYQDTEEVEGDEED